MDVSKINNNDGFTLIELIVVIVGLSVLASLSIPNVLNRVKINKLDEVKALMNGYALDCIGKYRTSIDYDDEFLDKAAPDDLSAAKLATLEYKIDKDKCSELAISPLQADEKDFFAFSFEIGRDGRVFKKGTPPEPTRTNEPFQKSCKNWAGNNCGMSAEDLAKYERIKALEKAKSECLSRYSTWLNAGSSGENTTWDSAKENCTRQVFAFEGIPVNSAEAIEMAQEAKYGRSCAEWRTERKDESKTLSVQNGSPQTKSPDCGGVDYYYHSGIEFTSAAAWTVHDNSIKKIACEDNRTNALKTKSGQYTIVPTPGPDPCGKAIWICKGTEYPSPAAYAASTCGAPPPSPPAPVIPARCKYFRPSPWCRGNPKRMAQPWCQCK